MNIFDIFAQQLDNNTLQGMANKLGVNNEQLAGALGSAVPILMNALQNNASTAEGAGSLLNALQKDHDGSIFSQLGNVLSNPSAFKADGILGHILGSNQKKVEEYIGQTNGLSAGISGQLLQMLAPMLMGLLGQQQKQSNLDAGGLFDMLTKNNQNIQQKAPVQMSFIEKLLDRNNDGSIMDDVLNIGMSIFKSRR
ncbi:MAG: DUF937 domain-containing protein [Chitinophagales bacterium]|nr:DUF937 domain-containing protein [Bacteroidota bacterium]